MPGKEDPLSVRPAIKHHNSCQHGFTLLEMVLVLFLVGLMASTTLLLSDNVEDQAKYDDTLNRMQLVRQAIVGDPTRTLNNRPDISGFAADMGRLPACLRELLEALDCANPANALIAWQIDAVTGVAHGWRGPYLQVLPESGGNLRFRDGYANIAPSALKPLATIDSEDFGWTYDVLAGGIVNLVSDSFDTTATTDDISSASLVVSADWEVSAVTVNITNTTVNDIPPSDQDVDLRIYSSDASQYKTSNTLTISQDEIPAGETRIYTFVFNAANYVPIGKRAFSLVCNQAPAQPSTFNVFQATCTGSPPDASTIENVSIAARHNLVLDWTI